MAIAAGMNAGKWIRVVQNPNGSNQKANSSCSGLPINPREKNSVDETADAWTAVTAALNPHPAVMEYDVSRSPELS